MADLDGRFVRVMVCDTQMWGVAKYFEYGIAKFFPIYCEDTLLVDEEFGDAEYRAMSGGGGLIEDEENSIVDAEEVDTPDEAWAALAKWRLTQ